MTLAAGSRLGQYEIVSPLGAGGMGEVYKARDGRLDREVAVKVLPEKLAQDADALSRFEREAKAVAALSHPNILAIHDFGSSGGVSYAVMELLEGETLRERLSGGALSRRKAMDYAQQIAQGLAAAHGKGIVHRDLKPENLFVTSEDRIKILDFGLARVTRPEADVTSAPTVASATEPGTAMGTVGYMSPEQIRGLPADHRSDIFSFGAVVYEMLSGSRAFRGDSAIETMNAILKEDPPDLVATNRNLSPGLERIVWHCLEKNPELRFQSVRDVAFDLETLSGVSSEAVRPLSSPEPARRGIRLWLSAAALALLLAVAFFAGRRFPPAGTQAGSGEALPRFSFAKLTEDPGVESFPSLSPDGKTLAYVSLSAGNEDIFVRRVGGSKSVNLTEDSPEDDTTPAFSPRGDQIAFRSERGGGGIFVMGATGESVRRLSDSGFNPAWSPDGREVAVAAEAIRQPFSRLSARSELWAIEVASGRKRPISTEDAVQPSWSPRGLRIAYWGLHPQKAGQRDIWTVPAAGGAEAAPVAVTDDAALDWNPVWSPAGRFLYFGSDRGGTLNLWRVGIDEETGKTRGEPEPLTTPSGWSGQYSLSADGRQIAYFALEERMEVQRAPFDPAAARITGPPASVLRGSRLIESLDASPDGEWLTFRSRGQREDLFIVRTDGTGLRQLTDDGFRDRGPEWSPDGKRIAFYSNRGGQYDIWAVNPDGSGLVQLTRGKTSDYWFPRWSPDGTRLAFSGSTGSYLFRPGRPDAAPSPEPLPRISQAEHFRVNSWSPDGEKLAGLAVQSSSGAAQGLTLYSLASRSYERLTPDGRMPKFLRDGKRLAYVSEEGVLLLEIASKKPRLLFPAPRGTSIAEVEPSADNRWLYLLQSFDEGDIWKLRFE